MPEETSSLPPLRDLKVIRDTYCSQEMADRIIHFLQERRPDLIEDIATELKIDRDSTYNRRINNALCYLQEEANLDTEIPATRLGRLDLMYELSRRVAKTLGLADLELIGEPLANGPDEPLPPLVAGNLISEKQGVTQEMANKAARIVYESRPDILFELSEQMRRMIDLDEIDDEFFDFIESTVEHDIGIPKGLVAKAELLSELYGRLHNMMGSPTLDD